MKLLVTLSKFENIRRFSNYKVDGIIVGTELFSNRYKFKVNDLKRIAIECLIYGLDFYVCLDTMIDEGDRAILREYLEFVSSLNPKGIYYSDLAVYRVLKSIHFEGEYIYDPVTLITNSLDASFYLSKGMDAVVLGREITIDEALKIAKKTKGRVDMQVFGYLKNAMSKRKFLSNYFEHLDTKADIKDKQNIRIVEETRDYKMPIIESKYGTDIYTDYILLSYLEYEDIKENVNHMIIDDIFIDYDMLVHVLKDYMVLNKTNAKLLENNLKLKYENETFDKGYFYQKTNITK